MGDNGRVNDARSTTHSPRPEDERPTDKGSRLYPRVTSFRSRRGALTAAQQATWDTLWPKIGRDVADEHIDVDAWFGRSGPAILEIGSGTGTATTAMAKAEPHVNLMAVEVYRPGLAQTLQQIERDDIENIRLLRGDAMDVLENMLTSESLTGVRVFFPDPWPKARHHKRRLLQGPTFAMIADRLKPGGVLHVATDHAEYAEWIAEAGNAEPRLSVLDWESPMTHERPVTKFEGKAQLVGSSVTELIWGKSR
ncbi:tRNA (guanosine(46)-N7)-methyltransferase TrmB [Rhodococcus sp. BP-252]|uniref:tRNA (guanine-N(7)-)-methyltransferase n=1 Tax=Rhodococcoides kyotonense TaxID=398843 RepID=A0A177YC41_9NOCA|nr:MULTISPECIES: tRNA (guanosine(46)-N7)-methyltransferase TrmB [Rhodococcus]MBY6412932.1 tRNA (guanosine(46)-N7)-methyltransferase TrmB [Rhodococcus sp. BP-320]MBY6419466.1 tRNA (guanosine(46)-N7)-methyltransferase TrmB [Rhodococcus sp. BP-321]MBY6423874.1 tRNA (guanosine(46)-N7)-methyltransferase TrmB [Rhodococcus sp. BP-324]MBY6429116.1 tRNA (guanosine(46)-N7)-methyltransferase TrmB [Rhodococcus sp. BP-323]MBY6432854.1 tRNA (guanosine(46)-N7)-methyltransferase TrmB [Rhodococcus sp. BP-322]